MMLWSMIPKIEYRFSEKIMLNKKAAEYAGRNVRPRQPMEVMKAMAGSPDARLDSRHARPRRRLAVLLMAFSLP